MLVWVPIYLTVHRIDCASLAARNRQEAFWTCKARAVADSFFSRTGAELPGDCAVVLDSFIRVTCFLPFGRILWNLQILGKRMQKLSDFQKVIRADIEQRTSWRSTCQNISLLLCKTCE